MPKELILDLYDFLRRSSAFTRSEGLTTMSRELKIVRAYLNIEHARYKDRLKINIEAPEGIDCTVPILCIQPLVENSIRHGVICKAEGGTINVRITQEENRLRIEVSDNGIGIETEKALTLLNGTGSEGGVGLENIHRRLVTLYGDGLHIESAPAKGTAVSFFVPYQNLIEKETNDEIIDR